MSTLTKNIEIPLALFRQLGEAPEGPQSETDNGNPTGMVRTVAGFRGTDLWLALREERTDVERPYAQLILCATENCARDQGKSDEHEIAHLTSDRSFADSPGPRDEDGISCLLEIRQDLIQSREINVRSPEFAALAILVSAIRDLCPQAP